MSLEDIFYKREALSVDGQIINVYKFRTMVVNAPDMFPDLVLTNGRDYLGKIIDDPRITPVGKVLRRYWIDEIPQFYNVLIGEMSLIGIRPKDKAAWNIDGEKHMRRCLNFKPGLVGINYLFSSPVSRKRSLALERYYCMKKRKNSIKTDIEFGMKIMYNIFFKGLRSS